MDVGNMLAQLRQDLEQLNAAIMVVERLARGRANRRGRPPAFYKTTGLRLSTQEIEPIQVEAPKRRGRPSGSKSKPKR